MKGFSFIVFLIIFLVLSILSACISGGYFYFDGKRISGEAADDARIYSLPLAAAFADIAAVCVEKKDYSRLKSLFGSDIFKKNIKEAFFVLADGKIIAHSDSDTFSRLKGDLSNDRDRYNTEKIFLPLKSKSADAQFLDYNIPGVKTPFNKGKMKVLSGYFNSRLEYTGWLVSKAVTVKGNGAGCICFLIGKDTLYKRIERIYGDAVYLLLLLLVISLSLALIVATAVYLRYRSISGGRVSADLIPGEDCAVKDAVRIVGPETEREQTKISSWEMTVPASESDDEELKNDVSKIIKDAIPVSRE